MRRAYTVAVLFVVAMAHAQPVVTQTGFGFFTPTADRPTQGAAVAMAAVANTAYCHTFYLPFTRTITNGRFYVNASAAGSFGDIGIYNLSGNLLANLGAISTAATTVQGGTILQSSVTLQGWSYYWVCQTNSSVTPTVNSISTSANIEIVGNSGTVTNGTFTAGVSGGVLPSTMGALTANNATPVAITYWW